jgi:hypothetical protein
VRNSIIYDGTGGIRTNVLDAPRNTATIENCTIFGMIGRGIDEDQGDFTVRNTISMANGNSDFDIVVGTQSNNISEDATAACGSCLANRDDTDLASPGAPPQTFGWVMFQDLTLGNEDFHLQDNLALNDAQEALGCGGGRGGRDDGGGAGVVRSHGFGRCGAVGVEDGL